jgi:hypothetical protein
MYLQVVEILRPINQGQTQPVFCKGEDGNNYFVKGYHAGRRSLINEYVCGRLALALGLPVADFEIVEIQAELVELSCLSNNQLLQPGLAFGSREVIHAQELSYTQRSKIAHKLRRDVLMFDWWIRNGDRTLTEVGGNPNLLWDQRFKKLAVIDHNSAFDRTFNIEDFKHRHVFGEEFPVVFGDMLERNDYRDRLATILPEFDEACSAVPAEWWHVDHGVPTDFDRSSARAILSRILDDNFWE